LAHNLGLSAKAKRALVRPGEGDQAYAPGAARLGLGKVGRAHMTPKRVTIIPDIHGKVTRDGQMSEPDIYWILEKWLERHPEVKNRVRDIRIEQGRMTLLQGIETYLTSVSIVAGDDIEGYDPAQDQDLYAFYLWEAGENL
jgi:hypothetical protein